VLLLDHSVCYLRRAITGCYSPFPEANAVLLLGTHGASETGRYGDGRASDGESADRGPLV